MELLVQLMEPLDRTGERGGGEARAVFPASETVDDFAEIIVGS